MFQPDVQDVCFTKAAAQYQLTGSSVIMLKSLFLIMTQKWRHLLETPTNADEKSYIVVCLTFDLICPLTDILRAKDDCFNFIVQTGEIRLAAVTSQRSTHTDSKTKHNNANQTIKDALKGNFSSVKSSSAATFFDLSLGFYARATLDIFSYFRWNCLCVHTVSCDPIRKSTNIHYITKWITPCIHTITINKQTNKLNTSRFP